MMGDLKKRASFARIVNYVNNPKKARLIDSKDVRLDSNATIAASMQGQADDKPGRRLKNPVYHISLDFAHEDTPRLTDALMTEIAREYMRRMGITDTQYIVCRHTDTEHQHVHIVANRVDNNGNTISDRNDAVRNVTVCKALTREYGLHFSRGKEKVKRDRLRGKDRLKYRIYDTVKAALPRCNSWSELCDRLAKQGIGVNFKLDRRNGNIIGELALVGGACPDGFACVAEEDDGFRVFGVGHEVVLQDNPLEVCQSEHVVAVVVLQEGVYFAA